MSKKKNRKAKIKSLNKSFLKFKFDVKLKNPDANFKGFSLYQFLKKSRLNQKPQYSELISSLLNFENCFAETQECFENEIIEIPKEFSIIENHTETCVFLKKLFNTLYKQNLEKIIFDYKNCDYIDVCASMVMDLILSDFISYYSLCGKGKHRVKIKSIKPINIEKYEIRKILFSIGAFRNIKNFEIKFDNIVAFPIIIGNKDNPRLSEAREVDITMVVDYIINSLSKLNRTLTSEAETNFYKVIGEVIQNAEEHSSTKARYCIGYFEMNKDCDTNYGVFNLAILNFGDSFYDTFKKAQEPNQEVVEQMRNLSKKYTTSNWFKKKKFEEETLWTLYILQDGVTRYKDWDRGNGTMRFIENFLNLKGVNYDKTSKMVLTTGHTKIVFDGTYQITEKVKQDNEPYKMITFNETGDIENQPDINFVKYEDNLFPGTLLSVKLKLDIENTEYIN